MKSIVLFASGLALGIALVVITGFTLKTQAIHATAKKDTAEVQIKYPLKATLYRFQINLQNKAVYEEWVKWHSAEKQPILETMERERMYVESVFRDAVHEPGVIYWLAFNGTGGENYSTSDLAADKKHAAYIKRILIKGSGIMLKTDFLMVPQFLEKSIAHHQVSQ